jgi:hypothetical protein
MVLSIKFLEDKHKILLHLSIFYEYQQFFQHHICFSIQPPNYSDPWPTLARFTSFFLIMLFNNFLGKVSIILKRFSPCIEASNIIDILIYLNFRWWHPDHKNENRKLLRNHVVFSTFGNFRRLLCFETTRMAVRNLAGNAILVVIFV